MTPPQKLRELADRLEVCHATRDRAALAAIGAELLAIVGEIEDALDPVDSLAASIRRTKKLR